MEYVPDLDMDKVRSHYNEDKLLMIFIIGI